MKKNVISVELISDLLNEELKNYSMPGVTVQVKQDPEGMNGILFYGALGIARPNGNIEFYVSEISKFLDRIWVLLLPTKISKILCRILTFSKSQEKLLKEVIKRVVVHEFRHQEQYQFLRNKGLDVLAIVDDCNRKYEYLENPFERDAIAFSKGKVNDLNTVFAQYL